MQDNIHFEEQVPLAPMTTMRVGGAARYLVRIDSEDQVPRAAEWATKRKTRLLVLGGGSNMVVSDSGWNGVVLKMENTGIEVVQTSTDYVEVRVQAGVCWDDLVAHTVDKGWWGIENMSFVPGTVGACPVQNVGAYGQECSTVIDSVNAFDTRTKEWVSIPRGDCNFGYRKSIFNSAQIGRYIITAVIFRLRRYGQVNVSRKAVAETLKRQRETRQVPEVSNYSQADIRNAIILLRSYGGGLPQPDTAGSCGSFFQTRIVSRHELFRIVGRALHSRLLLLAGKLLICNWKLSTPEGVKVPPRNLIKCCGAHRLASGNIELLGSNCTVVIHRGDDKGAADILELIRKVRNGVYRQTGFSMPVEPLFVGFSEQELQYAFALDGQHPPQQNVSYRSVSDAWEEP